MLSVVRPLLPLGPFSLALQEEDLLGPDFTACAHIGDRVLARGPILTFGDLQIDTSGAEVWQARPDWPRVQAVLKARQILVLDSIFNLLLTSPPESLAHPAMRLGHESEYGQPGLAGVVHRSARPRIASLQNGLRSGDLAEIRASAAGLAGLGPGLTPAGDDFLVGVVLGLWAAWPPAEVLPLARLIVRTAAPRTTRLSAAWLAAAARGETDAVWHDLLASLSTGWEREINAAGQRILARGHTSGADALAGFWMALSVGDPDDRA